MPETDASQLLRDATAGDSLAVDRLVPLVYDELRRIAQRQLRHERPDHTLDATGLVHEAYARLVQSDRVEWKDRAHFLGIAARAMRQILIDHARRRNAGKRGGEWIRTTLTGRAAPGEVAFDELLALEDALAGLDERQRRVVEYRFYGGMSEEEIAEVLGVSVRTVQREWTKARAWLYRALYPGDG